jgi:hypothetical protein
MLAWLRCVQQRAGGDVQTLGLWNEDAQPSTDYVRELRVALDGAGFAATRIAVMDNAYMNTGEVWPVCTTRAHTTTNRTRRFAR